MRAQQIGCAWGALSTGQRCGASEVDDAPRIHLAVENLIGHRLGWDPTWSASSQLADSNCKMALRRRHSGHTQESKTGDTAIAPRKAKPETQRSHPGKQNRRHSDRTQESKAGDTAIAPRKAKPETQRSHPGKQNRRHLTLDRKDGTENGTEDGTEDGTENGTEDETENGTEDGTENGTEDVTEDGTENGTEDGTESVRNMGTENGTENGTEHFCAKNNT
jgi:hypothetical protein